MSPKKFSPKEFSPQKFSPKKIFTKKVFTLKISTQKIQYNFHLKYSIVRLSFVDLRWAQLYVSLVVFLFGISDQQQDLTQEPETGTWIHYSKMKTWRQKQTGQFEVFWIREVISEDDEVTIEYHEVTTTTIETNTIQTTQKTSTIGTTLHTRRVTNGNFNGPVLDNTKPAFYWVIITDINSRLSPPMAVAKRKLRRAGEPVRAIVGGGSKSMAKMENKARLGSGGFLGRLGFFGTCKYWRLDITVKYDFYFFTINNIKLLFMNTIF